MDIASLLGFVIGISIIVTAIASGGDMMMYVDVPSILIVFGGTFGVSLMRISLGDFFTSFSILSKTIFNKRENLTLLIADAVRLAEVARKNGLLALEHEVVKNAFLKKGIKLCLDGHEAEFIRKMLTQEIDLMVARNEVGQSMWRGVGDLAPAMGMIGTLVGLVKMLSSMNDPAAIGPSMAVALLTTLYGAMISNCFAIPLVDKLAAVLSDEKKYKELVVETISGIQEGTNPKVLEALLNSFVSEKQRKINGVVNHE